MRPFYFHISTAENVFQLIQNTSNSKFRTSPYYMNIKTVCNNYSKYINNVEIVLIFN